MMRDIWIPGIGTILLAAVGVLALLGGGIWLLVWIVSHLEWV